jgi:hypothetical protein
LAVDLDLETSNPALLDDAQLVDAIAAFDRVVAWAGARQDRLLAEFARRRPGDHPEAAQMDTASVMSPYAPDEIGLALRLARGTAAARLHQAVRLTAVLPETVQAWQDGHLDLTKVRAILDATDHLDPVRVAAVQDRVLPRAGDQTAGQLRAALGRAVIAVDTAGAAERHKAARRERRVAVTPDRDGMASLWALLPAPDALSAYEWLTRLARGMGGHDSRGMDARRADLLTALLTGRLTVAAADATPGGGLDTGGPDATSINNPADDTADDPADDPAPSPGPDGGPASSPTGGPADAGAQPEPGRVPMPQPVNPGKPLIQVIVPLTTLTGHTDHPGDLVGYGPIPADLAREIAADAVWKRLITDPTSGALLDHGRTTYRPPTALADYIRARDVTCRHPTCRRRASTPSWTTPSPTPRAATPATPTCTGPAPRITTSNTTPPAGPSPNTPTPGSPGPPPPGTATPATPTTTATTTHPTRHHTTPPRHRPHPPPPTNKPRQPTTITLRSELRSAEPSRAATPLPRPLPLSPRPLPPPPTPPPPLRLPRRAARG